MNVRINETVLAGVGVEQEQRGKSSGSGPSREERADQGPVWWLTMECALGRIAVVRQSPWMICHCRASRGKRQSY